MMKKGAKWIGSQELNNPMIESSELSALPGGLGSQDLRKKNRVSKGKARVSGMSESSGVSGKSDGDEQRRESVKSEADEQDDSGSSDEDGDQVMPDDGVEKVVKESSGKRTMFALDSDDEDSPQKRDSGSGSLMLKKNEVKQMSSNSSEGRSSGSFGDADSDGLTMTKNNSKNMKNTYSRRASRRESRRGTLEIRRGTVTDLVNQGLGFGASASQGGADKGSSSQQFKGRMSQRHSSVGGLETGSRRNQLVNFMDGGGKSSGDAAKEKEEAKKKKNDDKGRRKSRRSLFFKQKSNAGYEEEEEDIGIWALRDQHLTEKVQAERQAYGVDVDRYCKARDAVKTIRVEHPWSADQERQQELDDESNTKVSVKKLSDISHKLLEKGCRLPISVDKKTANVHHFEPFRRFLPSSQPPLVSVLHDEYQYSGFADGSTILWLWRDSRCGSHEMVFKSHRTCVRALASYDNLIASASDGGLICCRDVDNNGEESWTLQLPFFRGARMTHRKRLGTCVNDRSVLWDGKTQEAKMPMSAGLGAGEGNTDWDRVEFFMTCTSMCFIQTEGGRRDEGGDSEGLKLVIGTNNGVLLVVDTDSGELQDSDQFAYFDSGAALPADRMALRAPSFTALSSSVYCNLESTVILAGMLNHQIMAIDIDTQEILTMCLLQGGPGRNPGCGGEKFHDQGVTSLTGHKAVMFAAVEETVYCVLFEEDGAEGEIKELQGHEGTVHSLDMAPEICDDVDDDDICDWVVVSGSDDNTIRVWRAEQTSEGSWAIGPFMKNTGRLETSTQLILSEELEENRMCITNVFMVFNYENKLEIISAHQDKVVAVWGLGNTEESVCHRSRVGTRDQKIGAGLVVSRDQRVLCFAVEKEVVVWDVAVLGRDLPELEHIAINKEKIQEEPEAECDDDEPEDEDGMSTKVRRGTATKDKNTEETGQKMNAELARFEHDDEVTCLCMGSDAIRVFSGSADRTVRCWRIGHGVENIFEHEVQGQVTSVCMSNQIRVSRSILFVGDTIGAIHIWEAGRPAESPLQTLRFHAAAVLSLSTHGDATMFISGSADNSISIWKRDRDGGNQSQFSLIHHLAEHDGNVNSVNVGSNGRRSISASDDMTIYMWNMDDPNRPVQTLLGHTSSVNCAVMSSDMQTVYSAEKSGLIYVWDLISGTVRRTLGVRGSRAVTALFLLEPPDKAVHFLLTLSDDQNLRVWRLAKTERLFKKGHQLAVSSVKMSDDGKTAVSASLDGKLIIWDTENCIHKKVFAGHTGPVSCVDMSKDSRLVVSGSADNTVRLWSVDLGCEVGVMCSKTNEHHRADGGGPPGLAGGGQGTANFQFDLEHTGHDDQVTSVRLATPPNRAPAILSGGLDQLVFLWEMGKVHPVNVHQHSSPVSVVAICHEGRLGAFGGVDGSLAVWLMHETLPPIKNEKGLRPSMFATDSAILVDQEPNTPANTDNIDSSQELGGFSGLRSANEVLLHTGKPPRPSQAPARPSQAPSGGMSAKMRRGASTHFGTEASLFENKSSPDLDGKKSIGSIPEKDTPSAMGMLARSQTAKLGGLIPNKSRETATSLSMNKTWSNVAKVKSIRQVRPSSKVKSNASVLKRGQTGNLAETLLKRQAELETEGANRRQEAMKKGAVTPLIFHTGSVMDLCISSDTQTLVAASSDRYLSVWSLRHGESWGTILKTIEHQKPLRSCAISADTRMVIAGDDERGLFVWDFPCSVVEKVCIGHTGAVNCISTTPDGSKMVTGGKELFFWDLWHGSSDQVLKGHDDGVMALQLSSNNRTLVSGSKDNSILVWDLSTGRRESKLFGHDANVSVLVLSADGEKLVSGGWDSRLFLWDLKTGAVLQRFESADGAVQTAAMSHDLSVIASASRLGRLTIWDPVTAKSKFGEGEGAVILDVKGACRCLCLAQCAEWCVASSEFNFTVQVWNLNNGHLNANGLLKGHKRSIVSLALVKDDEWLFSADIGGHVLQWQYDHLEDCFEVVRDTEGWPDHFRAFCRDGLECMHVNDYGSRMLVVSRMRRVSLWDIVDEDRCNEPIMVWKQHDQRVPCAALAQDCSLVVTGSYDNTICVHPLNQNSTLWFNLSCIVSAIDDPMFFELLLRCNPSVVYDKVYPLGWSLLHWFSSMGNVVAVKRVLKYCSEKNFAPGFTFDVLDQTVLDIVRAQSNLDMADDFLRQAVDWPPHSVEFSTWSVCRLLQYNLMNMVPFLDCRLEEPIPHAQQTIPTRAFIRNDDPADDRADLSVIGIVASAFSGLKSESYVTVAPHHDGRHYGSSGNEALVPVQITVWCIYLYRLLSRQSGFLQELAKADDTRIFSSRVVRVVLLYKWNTFGRRAHMLTIRHYALQLISFIIWLFQLARNEDSEVPIHVYVFGAVPAILSVSHMVIEMNILFKMGIREFKGDVKFWWAVGALANLLVVFSYIVVCVTANAKWRHTQAFASLLLWMQTFFYFRGFSGTGGLVRVVAEVLHDMRFFFFMMLVMSLAFSFTFFRLQPQAYDDISIDLGIPFAPGVNLPSPLVAIWKLHMSVWLGEIEMALFEHGVVDVVLFMGCSVFMTTVLLNLLIAIISGTVMRTKEKAIEAFYKELASLLLKLEHWSQVRKNHKPGQLQSGGSQDQQAYLMFSTKRSAHLGHKSQTEAIQTPSALFDEEMKGPQALSRNFRGSLMEGNLERSQGLPGLHTRSRDLKEERAGNKRTDQSSIHQSRASLLGPEGLSGRPRLSQLSLDSQRKSLLNNLSLLQDDFGRKSQFSKMSSVIHEESESGLGVGKDAGNRMSRMSPLKGSQGLQKEREENRPKGSVLKDLPGLHPALGFGRAASERIGGPPNSNDSAAMVMLEPMLRSIQADLAMIKRHVGLTPGGPGAVQPALSSLTATEPSSMTSASPAAASFSDSPPEHQPRASILSSQKRESGASSRGLSGLKQRDSSSSAAVRGPSVRFSIMESELPVRTSSRASYRESSPGPFNKFQKEMSISEENDEDNEIEI